MANHTTSAHAPTQAQGGGFPPGGYGGGPPPGYGSPAGYDPQGGYGPPGAPGGYGPPGAPYGAPPAPGGNPGGAPASPSSQLKKEAQTWLLIGIASSVLCTCCFGLIAAIFCYMAMQASDHGNLADARSKLRWGKIITIVGLVLGTLLTIVSLVYARDIASALRDAVVGISP